MTKPIAMRLAGFILATFMVSQAAAVGPVTFEPDADGNGVRDDVEAYIKAKYSGNPALIRLLQDYTRAFQQFVASYDKPEKSKEIVRGEITLYLCLDRFEQQRAMEFVKSEIKPRILDKHDASVAYTKAIRNLGVDIPGPLDEEVNDVCSKYLRK